jgi:catechol 2,3-dioxygenase-like lactoylglutathione lyase family enzyme
MADSNTATHIARVGRVIVPVSDQDRALEFYTETLGFEKGMDVPFEGSNRWLEVKPPNGETTIAIVPPGPNGPAPGTPTGISFETDDADALHAYLTERGVDVDDEVMRMGDPVPPMFFFRDQDGNRLLAVEVE